MTSYIGMGVTRPKPTPCSTLTVSLIHDHELVRLGLATWLSSQFHEMQILASVSTIAELRAGPGWGSNIVILDVNLEDDSCVESKIRLMAAAGSKILAISKDQWPRMVRRTLEAGALAYVPRSATASEMSEAIHEVGNGRPYMTQALALALLAEPALTRPKLSPQELRTLQMYAGGMPLKSVALRLGITQGAVKSYVDRIRQKYHKLGRTAPTKIELYQRAVEDGYLPELVFPAR